MIYPNPGAFFGGGGGQRGHDPPTFKQGGQSTVLLKMLGTSDFYSIKYSILKLLSQKLVCMSIFDIQKYIPNFF